jgi:hypothetical protein
VQIDQWLDVLFGAGDDDHPFWLTTIRVNILVFLACALLTVVWNLAPDRWRKLLRERAALRIALALTIIAALLRFAVASPNLMDFGGIPYSRLLFGYKGYFATAQFFSPFYELTARDIEHAILFHRIAGTLTIPLVYVLCRHLQPGARLFPATAAFLFAVYPLHIVFSASDALAIFSVFLAASSYVLLAGAEDPENQRIRKLRYLGGFAGLALLTQVRYENVLLLVPAALVLLSRRRTRTTRDLVPALAGAAAFIVFYAYEALTSGLSYRNPFDLNRGLDLTIHHLALNPFIAIPALFAGTASIWLFGRWRLGILALLPWAAAFLLCVGSAEDGHGCARIFANWLILLLPIAAYGFSLLLQARYVVVRAAGAAALLYFASLPVITRDLLAAQHLEILENDRFKNMLADLPPGIERIIVPDDELMLRKHHSTLEIYRKYEAIFWYSAARQRGVQLVSLTNYLAGGEACARDTCLFFAGLPCMDGLAFPETRAQCEEILRSRLTSSVERATVTAGPFVSCSIYTGRLHEQICAPATQPREMVVYRIEG